MPCHHYASPEGHENENENAFHADTTPPLAPTDPGSTPFPCVANTSGMFWSQEDNTASGVWIFDPVAPPVPPSPPPQQDGLLPLPLSSPHGMPGDAMNPCRVELPQPDQEIVTMDRLAVGLDPFYQIIVLTMESSDPAVKMVPILQLNLLGAVQLMQMLRAQVRAIEKLPPLTSASDIS